MSARGRPENAAYREAISLLFEAANGSCQSCGWELFYDEWAVDHCHDTGYIRGLICAQCNALARDTSRGQRPWYVSEYLIDPPAFRVIGALIKRPVALPLRLTFPPRIVDEYSMSRLRRRLGHHATEELVGTRQ